MSRNYGSLNRRSGSAAWQWILIGVIIGFGCSAIILLAGLASGAFTVGSQTVADLPTQTPYIVTATSGPETATATSTQDLSTDVALNVQAPTATPTLNPTLLTLEPTAAPTEAATATVTAGSISVGNTSTTGGRFDRVAAIASPLVSIPGGQFGMGTTVAEITSAVAECQQGYGGEPGTCQLSYGEDSVPQHNVTVSPFQMETYEVSYEQYLTFLNSLGASAHRNGCLGQPCIQTRAESETSNITFDSANYNVNAAILDLPVTNVTWYGALAYCQSIGRRLPTEAEWERAARGDDGRVFPWGNEWNPDNAATRRATVTDKSAVDAFANISSPYGVINLAGNVAEWVSDWYDPRFYGTADATVPDPQGPATGTTKVNRGGSWDTVPFFARTPHRRDADPLSPTAELGFRCVADSNSAAIATQSTGPIDAQQPAGTVDPAALGVIPGATAANDEETTANQLNSAPTLPPRPTSTTPPSGVVPTLAPGG
ncbi:MAG: SUMF1/EgtB/PvdO family nonheme iron enzyme [Anaerolineae bacterium]